jgi:hypothetical protein
LPISPDSSEKSILQPKAFFPDLKKATKEALLGHWKNSL